MKSVTVPCSNGEYNYLLSPQGVGSPLADIGTCGSQMEKEHAFTAVLFLCGMKNFSVTIIQCVTTAITVLIASQCHAPPRKPTPVWLFLFVVTSASCSILT
jgi:hypothetical protein